MQEDTNPVDLIRSAKRTALKDVRNKHKDQILYNKRLGLSEVSEYMHNVTITEFKELLLKLKQKNVPLELLKKIKNSCVTLEYIETLFRCPGAFDSLIRILIGSDALKQLEAAACLTNLACGPHKCSHKVAKASGVYLVSFINGSSFFLQEQSAWALANVANDCLECFNVIKSQGVLPVLLKTLVSPSAVVVQSVVFALNACTKYEDPEITSLVQKGLPDLLLALVEQENVDKRTYLDAAFTLRNCCFLSVKYSLNIFSIEIVIKIIDILLKTMQNPELDKSMVLPLFQCIGFLSYNDKICQFLSSHANFYGTIYAIASSENCLDFFKLAFWTLSNVAVFADEYTSSDLKSFLDIMKDILKQEKSLTLQLLYYLCVLKSKNICVNSQLKEHGIYKEIKSLLECKDDDILEATRNFLQMIKQEQ